MRWLFIFVLVINVAYFTWQMVMHDETKGMVGSTVENIKPIFLLSEREQFHLAENRADDNHVVKNHAVKNNDKQVELLEAEQSETALLSTEEQVLVKVDSDSERQAKLAPLKVKVSPQNTCFTVGPFKDAKPLHAFIDDIKNNVTDAKIRAQEENELSVYWVYISPEKSRKDAKVLGQSLKAKKIKDFYIIRSGEKNNGISLGHFKSKYRATTLVKRVKNLGFDVKVEPVFKAYTVYWLNYQVANNENVPQIIFNKYEKFAVNNKIAVLERNCLVK